MRVVIVGAGIAGSSVTRAARAAGHDAMLVSHGVEHSRAAAALLRMGYHARRAGEPALFERTLALYSRWGVRLSAAGAWVTNYGYPKRPPRYDADWSLIDPEAPLLDPDIGARATATPRGVEVENTELTADAVVWCPGASLGDGVTYGVTWVHRDPDALIAPEVLRIHHFAPYKTIAAGVAGGRARLGSSSARSEAKAREQGERMLATAADIGIIRSRAGWTPVCGLRCKTGFAQQTGIHHTLGSLHRTGYALAPALAERLVAGLR